MKKNHFPLKTFKSCSSEVRIQSSTSQSSAQGEPASTVEHDFGVDVIVIGLFRPQANEVSYILKLVVANTDDFEPPPLLLESIESMGLKLNPIGTASSIKH